MSYPKICAVLFCVLSIAGCASADARKRFSAPPTASEIWSLKAGRVSELEIERSLLECGIPAPNARGLEAIRFFGGIAPEDLLELHACVDLCMQRSGFELRPGFTPLCKERPTLRACQPENAHLIPTRDPERRMNSVFCKAYPKADACQP